MSSAIRRRPGRARRMAVVTVSGAAALALASGTAAAHASTAPDHAAKYTFKTIVNSADPTYNELFAINDHGKIAGTYGAATPGHPARGYVVRPPYHHAEFRSQNFPHSKQSLVFGLNNNGVTVGAYSSQNPPASPVTPVSQFGYYAANGHFHKVNYPTKHPFSPPVDQLLGINDQGVAVGFYLDSHGTSHAYRYNIHTHKYKIINPGITGGSDYGATAINDAGSVVGYFTTSGGKVEGFFSRTAAPHLIKLSFPGARETLPFGVSQHGEVVGVWEDESTGTIVDHGFTWTRKGGFHTVDDPYGTGGSEVSGVNNAGELVGWYIGKLGNTKGFLAKPKK